MSRKCMISGAKVQFGNSVSHSNRKTRRTFQTNVKKMHIWSESLKKSIPLTVTSHGIRTIEHNGGLDAYLLSTPASRLTPEAKKLKKLLAKTSAKG